MGTCVIVSSAPPAVDKRDVRRPRLRSAIPTAPRRRVGAHAGSEETEPSWEGVQDRRVAQPHPLASGAPSARRQHGRRSHAAPVIQRQTRPT
eukprot:216877-Chlamydomonas_euryale.AAC.8